MNILVLGGGGREHAVVTALAKSPKVGKLYAAPGNAGIAKLASCVDIAATDLDGILSFAKKCNPDYVFVTPDDPLCLGMVDVLNANGFKTFGPNKAAAIIEGSKSFGKELMKKYHIPTARYELFTDFDKALAYLKSTNTYPAVIKCDGLALGKGVIIAQNEAEGEAALTLMMKDKTFGESGSTVLIEEFLIGKEVTVLCFTDGKTVKPMVSSMDHKRALDNDNGENTGGMGSISRSPYYTDKIAADCMENIFIPTITAMDKEGRPFKGCLYFGLILTENGAKVIEYNCRFGDPEAQVVLSLLDTDLVDIMEAVYNGTLDKTDIKWKDQSACCVVMASGGYPKNYKKGYPITGISDITDTNVTVYHAGTKVNNGVLSTNGGRVLGVTALGDTLPEAIERAYKAVSHIHFDNVQFRTDIGKR